MSSACNREGKALKDGTGTRPGGRVCVQRIGTRVPAGSANRNGGSRGFKAPPSGFAIEQSVTCVVEAKLRATLSRVLNIASARAQRNLLYLRIKKQLFYEVSFPMVPRVGIYKLNPPLSFKRLQP